MCSQRHYTPIRKSFNSCRRFCMPASIAGAPAGRHPTTGPRIAVDPAAGLGVEVPPHPVSNEAVVADPIRASSFDIEASPGAFAS